MFLAFQPLATWAVTLSVLWSFLHEGEEEEGKEDRTVRLGHRIRDFAGKQACKELFFGKMLDVVGQRTLQGKPKRDQGDHTREPEPHTTKATRRR